MAWVLNLVHHTKISVGVCFVFLFCCCSLHLPSISLSVSPSSSRNNNVFDGSTNRSLKESCGSILESMLMTVESDWPTNQTLSTPEKRQTFPNACEMSSIWSATSVDCGCSIRKSIPTGSRYFSVQRHPVALLCHRIYLRRFPMSFLHRCHVITSVLSSSNRHHAEF